MALVKCKKCKHEVTNTNLYCVHCGEEIPYTYECPECKHQTVINETDKENICNYCGFKLNQNQSEKIVNTITKIGFIIVVLSYLAGIIITFASFASEDGITILSSFIASITIIVSSHIFNVLLKGFAILIKNTNEIRKNTKK